MVSLKYLQPYFEHKKILVTGHTGFKGSWLIQILKLMKAQVYGFSLAPERDIDLYNQINGSELCESSLFADIRNYKKISSFIKKIKPDYIFHLAAQPLVIDSYNRPVYTFEVNGIGTANVLESIKNLKRKCVVVNITTDKVYENTEIGVAFKEEDKLGGYDPYSASKAVAEIIISSFKNSFFNTQEIKTHKKVIASARAGNVIGGGDYSPNRLLPDIINAMSKNENVELRNPQSVRPWQHVLEPLGAYLLLATKMYDKPEQFSDAYNFGPEEHDVLTVEEVTKQALDKIKKGNYTVTKSSTNLHEANLLQLNIDKAKQKLKWQPKLTAQQSIEWTIDWYINEREEAPVKCLRQINQYFENVINDSDEN